jgi:hypothetical protein
VPGACSSFNGKAGARASACRDVFVPQDVCFGFQIFQPNFDDVADANDADEASLGNDRQMPQAVICHQAHGALQAISGGNRDHGVGRDVQYR